MTPVDRRGFLEMGAAMAAALGVDTSGWTAAARETVHRTRVPEVTRTREAPDLVVVNARVWTVDQAQPRAEAFAVQHGRFSAVGSTADVRALAGPNTRVLDAAGMTVTPGFIDAHSHPSGVSELTGVNVNLRTVAEVVAALRAKAATTPPGYWVSGYMYDDTKLDRPVTRRDLDEAVPDHPASVGHRGGHTGVYNSVAFREAGVTASTPDPEGGRFYRENGELTGKVAERARSVFNRVGRREPTTRDTRRRGVAFISKEMTRAGLTSVHRTGGGSEDLIAFQDAYAAGELAFRMYFFPTGGLYDSLKASGIRTGFGDERLRIGAVKYGADGSASERTMRMSTPYVGRPDDYGILTMTPDQIREAVEDAHRAGFQIGIHANGDVTIGYVLDAYERAQREWPRADARHRIEHCSLVNPELLARISEAGVIPTPFYTYVYYHGDKWAEYGPEKMRWMFAHRSFLDYGIPVPGASDYMPGPYEPMMALQSLVTRTDYAGREWGPNQRVTVDEALRICTINGAHASFEEHIKGSITAGKLADFVVLADDPHDVDPLRLKDVSVVRTVVGGETVWEA
ncbi:MAG TPA: amidohydrolase [Vicinamibacterales bacterium]|nr:amidohydrolase [Vicinamibacterales bacterium]